MACPGLHSILHRLRLHAADLGEGARAVLAYRVRRFDDRFSLARIAVTGPTLAGELDAFYRPEPMAQPSFETLRAMVAPGEFAGVRALVVGGSRGLGEVTAKLLAAGGADVAITYRTGASEAEAVAAQIVSGGARAHAFALDVREPREALASVLGHLGTVTHLLYFASGPIFVAERGTFDARLFRAFCEVYVTGFAALVGALAPAGLARVLYPSSVAIDELPADMGEYAAAKAAGEAACAYLAKVHPAIVLRAPRLPRLATDQTRSLVPVREHAAAEVVLGQLRALS
jgi:NADP-dependent 3-hydroxy acid dehydrogenase YdfG